MSGLNRLLTEEIETNYLVAAQEEVKYYLKLTENEKLSTADKLNLINKVYLLTQRYAHVKDNAIQPSSLRKIQGSFSKTFEHHNLQLKLLELLLCVIEKNLKITAPAISQTCEIKQDIPLLKPDDFLMSRLQANIYELIENESQLASFLDSPQQNQAILIIWLVLKEGIDRSKDVKAILAKECNFYRVKNHWFVELNNQRYWLSSMAELLLTAHWNASPTTKVDVMGEVNKQLYKNRLLPFNYTLSFIDLRAFLKNEFILTSSPIEYSVCQGAFRTTSISQISLFRLVSGQRVRQDITKEDEKKSGMTVRQKVAWLSACANSAQQLRKKTTVDQEEVTTAEQLELINYFIKPLVKASLKESININKTLQDELRVWLETNDIAKATPWSWLVLSWLYQLLKFGGKYKKRLRLTTIRAYVTYIAGPFIQEFSGCDPKLMEHLDWAEKLNIIAEHITSTKKVYVLYLAEYLIESGLVTNLCLSDIDISSTSHAINANLITQQEADKIIKACDELDTPTSRVAKLCFCFGFYSGLRRGEIAGLQFADIAIAGNHYANLHIRPNKYRELKSSESSRNIPLDSLWPEAPLEFLIEFIIVEKTKFTRGKSLIFGDSSQLNESLILLTNIMKIVTGEPNIRFHHCRHSFCNWTWILLNPTVLKKLSEVDFCQHPYFSLNSSQRLCKRLAISPFSRKKFWALSGLLGHSSPDVTTSSYFHISELVRRTIFAKHRPSPSLLRRFWGQRIRIDEQGRLLSIPDSKKELTSVYPIEYKPEIDKSCINTAIRELVIIPNMEFKQSISLRSVWDIVCLLAEGHQTNDVSYILKIDEESVLSVLRADGQITQSSLRRSKYELAPLVNYTKLNRGNIKAINALVELFETAEKKELIPASFNFKELAKILTDLVGSKDNLIRTHNKNAALLLLKLMQVIGLTERHVKIKWYFPREKDCNINQLDEYKKHLKFWYTTISGKIFPNIHIEVIVPKKFAAHIKSSRKFKTTISDDGKYLKYHPPGTISIHVLQAKFDNERHDENGNKIFTPQRTRAFVSFLRLLAIYIKCRGE